ncbi:hypothetical protein FOG48_01006 [Hanseniaspora uvarum]|nr:hypothetical protein FOG48_01006 [Hanseniaspora uvarum]
MSQDKKLNTLVIGSGGVATITALSLDKRNKSDVSMIVRSDYSKAINDGYTIDSCDYGKIEGWKPTKIYKTVDESVSNGEFYDYVLVTTKNIPDGPTPVAKILEPVVQATFKSWSNFSEEEKKNKVITIIMIQNGIDIETEVYELLKADHLVADGVHGPKVVVLSGVQMIGSTRTAPATILQKGQDYLILGAFDQSDELAKSKVLEFKDIYLNEGHNVVEIDDKVRWSRWRKLIYNATINPLTAIVCLDFTRTLLFSGPNEATEFEILRPAMKEILAIAKAEGHIIDESVMDLMIDGDRTMIYKPSMMVDTERDQLMEIEVILGNPIRTAKKLNVPTPYLSMLYNIAHIIQMRNKEKMGLVTLDESTATLK